MRPFAPLPRNLASDLPKLTKFVPFDSATKISEATAVDPTGVTVCAVKGAFAAVMRLTQASPDAAGRRGGAAGCDEARGNHRSERSASN